MDLKQGVRISRGRILGVGLERSRERVLENKEVSGVWFYWTHIILRKEITPICLLLSTLFTTPQ